VISIECIKQQSEEPILCPLRQEKADQLEKAIRAYRRSRSNQLTTEIIYREQSDQEKATGVLLVSRHDTEISYPLVRSPYRIGRSGRRADLVIDNAMVSRAHAEITSSETGYWVRDLDSRNGTVLNGRPLIAGRRYKLKDGDRIDIADQKISFCLRG